MKRSVSLLAAAFGFATLCTLPVLSPFFAPDHATLYHLDGAVSTLLLTMALFLVLFGLCMSGVFLFVEMFAKLRIVFWVGLMAILPLIALMIWSVLLQWPLPPGTGKYVLCAGVITAILVLAFWRPSFLPHFNRLQHLTQTIFSVACFCTMLVLGQLVLLAWQVRAINAPQPLHIRSAAASLLSRPRVIWILLDELSYRQVYEHRFPGLLLPAFDRLSQESTLFTHVIPTGLMTEHAVPSLFSSVPSDAIRASSDGRQLFLHTPHSSWQPFDHQQTVFRDALDRGYSTAIAGWFNPYCRILAPVLDRCIWRAHNVLLNSGISTDKSISSNLLAPLDTLIRDILIRLSRRFHPVSVDTRWGTATHTRDYLELLSVANSLLNDSAATFVFLHLPVPHPDGIYDRDTHAFTPGSTTYLDNLVLADDCVAHLRSVLEQRNEWNSSTILITGDHSWRTESIWAKSPTWTAEEQAASDGNHFDDRPAYIVKLPNQQQPARIETSFQAIHTRALLDALMDRSIRSPQELSSWVSRQR